MDPPITRINTNLKYKLLKIIEKYFTSLCHPASHAIVSNVGGSVIKG